MSSGGIVAAGSTQSADAAAEILHAGGNAADAVVAGTLATSTGDAAITSLAGGGVFIFRDASGRVEICDGFVDAPGLDAEPGGEFDFKAVELNFGVSGAAQTFHVGRGAAAVPGLLPALEAVLERWGSIPFSEAVAPAVRFLRRGVSLTAYQVDCFRVLEPILRYSEEGRRRFCDSRGRLLSAGETFENPELAATLEHIGSVGFEKGYAEVCAEMLSAFGTGKGGRLTEEDLKRYRPQFRAPLRASYCDATFYTNPAPSMGGRFIAHTLSLFQRARLRESDATSPERYRRITAALRAVAELRTENEDLLDLPDFSRRAAERLDRILSDAPPPPSRAPESGGAGNTTHLSVIDRRGNAAGVTISHGEGCGIWIGDTGLHMNNVLGEDDLFPGGFHRFLPGMRLQTMMAPSVLEHADGAVSVFGTGGSNRIRTTMAQCVSNFVDDGLDPEEAVRRGRLHVENGKLSAETYALPGGKNAVSSARELVSELEIFDASSLFFGGVHVAQRTASGELQAAGDLRRGGTVRVVRPG